MDNDNVDYYLSTDEDSDSFDDNYKSSMEIKAGKRTKRKKKLEDLDYAVKIQKEIEDKMFYDSLQKRI